LKIVGTHHGYFDKARDSLENLSVVELVNKAGPDLLVVGMGVPLQELWLRDNWANLRVPVAMTGGAVFDYTAGFLRRPPPWMRGIGSECTAYRATGFR
jgi:N-acetylglucosaminyldiphosphoundecaprenol N-acetyl-beta-D-mannosaminyltransferase